MREVKTQQEYQELIEELLEHDRRYYEEFKPVISDYEYDQLYKKLEEFEQKHPELISPDSPTQRVQEGVSKGFKQGEHTVLMLSLMNTYSKEEVGDFIKRVEKGLGKKNIEFCTELKYDGTSISLRYEKGKLVCALTRGNGRVGDDVTANVKTIKSLPLQLKGNFPDILEVRGEIIMHKKTLLELNAQREEEGLDLWANTRNAAAGSLKLLDSKEVAKRKLDAVIYAVVKGDILITSQYKIHHFLHSLGLPAAKEENYSISHNLEEIFDFADKIEKKRDKLSFSIDGIVIKVDDLTTYETLGETGKAPRYAVAYKFAPEQAFTKIEEITVQVGRTGVLTPVAELKPVHLAGSTISRATLHNQDEIKRKDIRVGDWVVIEKGGDVIPKVVSVDLDKRPKEVEVWHMPKKCPICGTAVIHKEGEVAIRCPNAQCEGRNMRKLVFFASKGAMDIEHLGEKVIEQLVNKKLISRPSDIYKLTRDDLAQLEGFKEKSINNLLESIEASKKCSLYRFIVALSIKHIGVETAELLTEKAHTLEKLRTMSRDELLEIDGVGEKMADSVVTFFENKENNEEIDRLLKAGVEPEKVVKRTIEGHQFAGKIFVLTGTLSGYTRDEASKLIKDRGGKTSASVSNNTDYVLAGDDPGSKSNKAKELGIKIITEKEFNSML